MIFSSAIFLFAFLPVVLFFYFVIFRKNRVMQNIFLFIVSIFFYAWGEPFFVLVMLASIVFSWLCGVMIGKNASNQTIKKLWLTMGIVVNISLLFVFKYLGFFVSNISTLFGISSTIVSISLPIGISFFTFQAVSYVIDVYRSKKSPQRNPLYVGLYIAFFPQLIAGPIVRYETIADQIQNREESVDLFSAGIIRFIIGLGKKVIIANTLAIVADASFTTQSLNVGMAWLGAIAYAFQILYDFSGYSDMAIGLGKMFGFKFEENFNKPYLATSISDFWRRWHISMGTWFRDYVYFPLGGSRVKKPRMIFNLFIVWLLTGLWHGANWTFIVWGLIFFVFITLEKVTGYEKKKVPIVVKRIYTLLIVLVGWIFFRSESLAQAFTYIRCMFTGETNWNLTWIYLKENLVVFSFAIVCCLPVNAWIRKFIKNENILFAIKGVILIVIFIVSISYILKGTYNPFIYFNF